MEQSEHDLTPDDCSMSCDVIAELLEVAIHQILYTRELYPQTAFQRKRKYNIPIQVCLHPGVTRYVHGVVAGVKPLLQTGQLRALQLAVTAPGTGVVLEKFVFRVAQMVKRPHEIKVDNELVRLEESLRAMCLKLSISDSLLQQLPPKCSFRVLVQVPLCSVHLLHARQLSEEFSSTDDGSDCAWVEADSNESFLANPRIVPLKCLNSEICQLQLYVEESEEPRATIESVLEKDKSSG